MRALRTTVSVARKATPTATAANAVSRPRISRCYGRYVQPPLPLWGRAGWGLAGLLQLERRQAQPIARRVALAEQPLDRRRGQGPGEEISLARHTSEGLQGGKLLGPLDAVRHRHHAQGIAEVDD